MKYKKLAELELTDEQLEVFNRYRERCIKPDKPGAIVCPVLWTDGGARIVLCVMDHEMAVEYQKLVGIAPDARIGSYDD